MVGGRRPMEAFGYEWLGDMNPDGFSSYIADDGDVYCGVACIGPDGEKCDEDSPDVSWCAGCDDTGEYIYDIPTEEEAMAVAVRLYHKAKGVV